MINKILTTLKQLLIAIGYNINTIIEVLSYILFFTLVVGIIILINFVLYRKVKDNFNNYIDRTIPIFICAYVLLIIISLNETLLTKLIVLIFCLIIILPTYHLFGNLRGWTKGVLAWRNKHPSNILLTLDASIYPLIFLLYLTLGRYLRLDTTIDIYSFIPQYYFLVPWIIATISFLVVVSIIILYHLSNIKQYYWSKFIELVLALHIYMLKYKPYFFLFNKLHKLCYFIYVICTDHFLVFPHGDKKYRFSTWTALRFFIVRFLTYVYAKNYLIRLFLITFLVLEIILTGGLLHYGIYLLFLYPIINGLFHIIFLYSQVDFVYQASLCNHLSLSWKKPYYPHYYWWAVSTDESDLFPLVWNPEIFSQKELMQKSLLQQKYLTNQHI